jgi:hypothetical protein
VPEYFLLFGHPLLFPEIGDGVGEVAEPPCILKGHCISTHTTLVKHAGYLTFHTNLRNSMLLFEGVIMSGTVLGYKVRLNAKTDYAKTCRNTSCLVCMQIEPPKLIPCALHR